MPLKEIKQIYKENSKSKSYEIAFLVLIFRYLSPPFVYLLCKLKVNPMHVSYFNLIVVFIAFFLFFSYDDILLPIYLLIFWQFIDTLDGGVARTRNIISNYGGYVDQITGMLVLSFLPIAVGFATNQRMINGDFESNPFGSHVTSDFILLLGGLSSLFSIFSRITNYIVKDRFGVDNSKKVISDNSMNSIMRVMIINIENIGGINLLLLLMLSLFGLLPFYTLLFVSINFFIMMYVISKSLIDYRQFSEYLK